MFAGTAGPEIPKSAATPEGFVPSGWSLEQKQTADLNSDGKDDALLVLKSPQKGGTPQRIVAVVVKKGAGYVLAERNDQLIPFGADDGQEDPLAAGEITSKRGAFSIQLNFLGGARTATIRYGFRHQNGCFRLIGYDRYETDRATLNTVDTSINFLTGVRELRAGNAQGEKAVPVRTKLRENPRLCLADLESAATFAPR